MTEMREAAMLVLLSGLAVSAWLLVIILGRALL